MEQSRSEPRPWLVLLGPAAGLVILAWLSGSGAMGTPTVVASCWLAAWAASNCFRAACRSAGPARLAWGFLAAGAALAVVAQFLFLRAAWQGVDLAASGSSRHAVWAALHYSALAALLAAAFLKPHQISGRRMRPALAVDALLLALLPLSLRLYFCSAHRWTAGGGEPHRTSQLLVLSLGVAAVVGLLSARRQTQAAAWRHIYARLALAAAFHAASQAALLAGCGVHRVIASRGLAWTQLGYLLELPAFAWLALAAGPAWREPAGEVSLPGPAGDPIVVSAWRELFVPTVVLAGLLGLPLVDALFGSGQALSAEGARLRNITLTAALGLYVLLALARQFLVQMENRDLALGLKQESWRLRLVLSNIHDAVVVEGLDGRVVFANERFPEMFGLRREELPSLRLEDCVHPEDRRLYRGQHVPLVGESLRAGCFEFRGVRKDGEILSLESAIAPVRPGGMVLGYQSVIRDITGRKNLEAQLRQSQKMEAVGVLAGGIAHDFNNLLTVILGNISLALLRLGENHPAFRGLSDGAKAAERATELVQQLLGFSRKSRGTPRPLSLNSCVRETVDLFRRTVDPRIVLETAEQADLWLVEADPGQIHQVLINLYVNARDAMKKGGRLSITTANRTLDAAYCHSHPEARPGEFVELAVSDTGGGMDPAIRARIFEPFFTTKEVGKGTGLGLAVAYGILQQHHGWIAVESEPGRGSTFSVFLPRSCQPAELPAQRPAPAGADGSETILLVDDEEMIRNLGRGILESSGHRVLEACDGEQALRVLEQSLREPEQERVDLVLLDMTMPRKSGRDTLLELRRLAPQVPVVLASGYAPLGAGDLAAMGATAFIQKPYQPHQLTRTLREVLDSSAHRG